MQPCFARWEQGIAWGSCRKLLLWDHRIPRKDRVCMYRGSARIHKKAFGTRSSKKSWRSHRWERIQFDESLQTGSKFSDAASWQTVGKPRKVASVENEESEEQQTWYLQNKDRLLRKWRLQKWWTLLRDYLIVQDKPPTHYQLTPKFKCRTLPNCAKFQPDIWIRLPRHKWPKSWSSMEDPVVLHERNMYGHPLAGFLWERQFEEVLLELGWEKLPNWEFLFVHGKLGLFLSEHVEDKKKKGWKKAKYGCHIRDQSCLLQSDFVVTAAGPPLPHTFRVKTTPQMTRFRDVKVCKNLVTDEIDDHRVQSDYKCTIGLQYPGETERQDARHQWQRDHQDPEHLPHSAHEPQHVNWCTRDLMCA